MSELAIGFADLEITWAVHAATRLTAFPSRSMSGHGRDRGRHVRDVDWEANNARSGYRVRLADGKWYDVPNFALINPKTNKLGYAVVWLHPPTSSRIFCFVPGSGG
jgi:hypothetical protein